MSVLTFPVATEWFQIYSRIGWQVTSDESWNTFRLCTVGRTLITWQNCFLTRRCSFSVPLWRCFTLPKEHSQSDKPKHFIHEGMTRETKFLSCTAHAPGTAHASAQHMRLSCTTRNGLNTTWVAETTIDWNRLVTGPTRYTGKVKGDH